MSDYNILPESTISIVFRLLSGGMIFVKYNSKIYRLPVKLTGYEISSSTNDILFNLINNENDFKVDNIICDDCKKKFYFTFNGYNYGMTKLDEYVPLSKYGIKATSIPNEKSTLNLFLK